MSNESTEGTQSRWVTPKQAGTVLGVSKWTVYRLIDDGGLAAFRVRGQWRIPPSALRRYVERQAAERMVGLAEPA